MKENNRSSDLDLKPEKSELHSGSREQLDYATGENRRMLRNVVVISFSFTLLFTGYSSMSSLQSSINTEATPKSDLVLLLYLNLLVEMWAGI